MLLRLEGIEKTHIHGFFRGKVRALTGLDLAVARGEIHALVGPNGAGKTTTLKIILGLLRPTAGRGALFGLPLGHREARARLGFLPELPAYYPHLSPAEILRFARALSGVSRDERADRVLLESLGLGRVTDRPVRKMSKGQVQRLGLAQALVHAPELLILDEPMSGLDPLGRALVKDRLRREREAGRTILLSSHVLSDIEALADRVSLLSQGRLLVEGRPRDLLSGGVRRVVLEGEGPLPEDLSGSHPGLSCRSAGEGWSIRLEEPAEGAVDACLRRILAAGARVTRLETEREDLESFFVQRLEEENRRWAS